MYVIRDSRFTKFFFNADKSPQKCSCVEALVQCPELNQVAQFMYTQQIVRQWYLKPSCVCYTGIVTKYGYTEFISNPEIELRKN